jgi:hypothetical protein
MEWRSCGADHGARRWGATHARCTKSGGTAGEQRRNVEHAWNADAGASTEYLTAALDPDARSGRYLAATISANTSSGEYLATAVNADASSREYFATAVNADASSGEYFATAVNADIVFELDAAVFELDVAASRRAEPAQFCEQRTRHGERDPRASSYSDRHRAARIARRRYDGQSAGLLAEAWHREIGMRASRHFARRLAGRCDHDSATEATAVAD